MTKRVCPKGHYNSRDTKFCAQCGIETIAPPNSGNPHAPNFVPTRRSSSCSRGHSVGNHDLFCGTCGDALTISNHPQVPTVPLLTYSKRTGLRPSVAGWVQALLWTSAAASTLVLVKVFAVRSTFAIYVEAERIDTFAGSQSDQYDKFISWQMQSTDLALYMGYLFLLTLITLVLLVTWSNLATKASSALSPGKRRWSSGWAVGSWFIPLASLLLPKLVLDETEKIATAARKDGFVDQNWRKNGKLSANGWLWWTTRVAASLFILIGFQKFGMPADDYWDSLSRQPAGQDLAYLLLLVGNALLVMSSISGVFYVQQISRRLSPNSLLQNVS